MTRSMDSVSVSLNPVESRVRKAGNQCTLHRGRYIVHPPKQVLAQQHSCQFLYQLRYIRHEFVEIIRADQGMDS